MTAGWLHKEEGLLTALPRKAESARPRLDMAELLFNEGESKAPITTTTGSINR